MNTEGEKILDWLTNPSKSFTNKTAMQMVILVLAACFLCFSSLAEGLALGNSRRDFVRNALVGCVVCQTGSVAAVAADDKVDDATLKATVTADILERQFLATGDITRSIYNPKATFTDEIDTYQLEQWVKGTQRLFVGSKSNVQLVGEVDVQPDKAEFRFDEQLMFNIPFKPVVSLTGRVELLRDAEGRISSYQEFWDQSVIDVIKTAKFY